MERKSKSLALFFILIMAISSLSLLAAKPAFAQSSFSPSTTPESQTFSYNLPNYTVSYEITSGSTGYLIGLLVMDNPPIEISFYEQLPNGTENRVTKFIAYGMTIASTSYPTNVTFAELSEPTSTPTSTAFTPPIPTPASPTLTPTVPELSWLVIVSLLLSVLSVAVIVRHRKIQVKKL